jgi:hypothetical protein
MPPAIWPTVVTLPARPRIRESRTVSEADRRLMVPPLVVASLASLDSAMIAPPNPLDEPVPVARLPSNRHFSMSTMPR